MTIWYEELEDGAIGMNTPFEDVAKDLGLVHSTEKEIVLAWNGKYYFAGEEPEKPAPTEEEINERKAEIREKLIDRYTLRRIRKTANHTWTEEDEQEYLNLDVYVTGLIEEKFGVKKR